MKAPSTPGRLAARCVPETRCLSWAAPECTPSLPVSVLPSSSFSNLPGRLKSSTPQAPKYLPRYPLPGSQAVRSPPLKSTRHTAQVYFPDLTRPMLSVCVPTPGLCPLSLVGLTAPKGPSPTPVPWLRRRPGMNADPRRLLQSPRAPVLPTAGTREREHRSQPAPLQEIPEGVETAPSCQTPAPRPPSTPAARLPEAASGLQGAEQGSRRSGAVTSLPLRPRLDSLLRPHHHLDPVPVLPRGLSQSGHTSHTCCPLLGPAAAPAVPPSVCGPVTPDGAPSGPLL